MGSTTRNTIILIDDHPIIRRGLVSILEAEPGYEVIGQFDRAEGAFQVIEMRSPDLIIVDISLPGMNGIEFVKNIHFRRPHQKILILSRHEDALYAERSLRAGANGYVRKFVSSDILLRAIRKVLSGGIYLSEDMGEKLLLNMLSSSSDALKSPLDSLTDRELEVFELIGRGKNSGEISDQLHLAVKTIETYRSRIKTKLGVRNSSELVFRAVKWVNNED